MVGSSRGRLKEEYILVSSDGPNRNVLKLKPPLVFSHENADHFIKILDEVLMEVNDEEVSRKAEPMLYKEYNSQRCWYTNEISSSFTYSCIQIFL
jgi:hypothetical protein